MSLPKSRQPNCAVVILNAEDDALDPLLDIFYAEALLQKRRAVAAIDMQSIKLAILSDKSDPTVLAARKSVLSGQLLPDRTVAMFIKRKIDEYVHENERILAVQSANQQIDLLEFWMENDSPSMDATLPAAAAGKGKKPKEKEKEKASEGKLANKGKSVKFKLPAYVKKSRSTMLRRGQLATNKVGRLYRLFYQHY